MKLIVTIALALITLPSVAATKALSENSCSIDPYQLHAQYSAQRTTSDDKLPNEMKMELWRQGDIVMHSHPNGTGDIWHKLPNKQIRMDKYFDDAKRLIEYESMDLTTLGKTKTWDSINYLINKKLLTQLTKDTSKGSHCDVTDMYSGDINGNHFIVEWNAALDLLVSLSVKGNKISETWTLTSLTSSEDEIANAFTQRFDYMSTDFADVGDNESDPFLIKMINLGYIDHAPESVYDANGNNIARPAHSHEQSHTH